MLTVNAASSVPVYEQLIAGILGEVERGALRKGDRLPTVRRLAEDLGIAPGTVAKAYQYLEVRGTLHTQGRRGTFIAEDPDARDTAAREAAERYLSVMLDELGYTRRDAVQHLTRIAEVWRGET